MSAFDNPATRLPASILAEVLSLFATRSDVCGKAEFTPQVAHLVRVIPLIQTHALRSLGRRLRALDHQFLHGAPCQLHVMAIRTLDDHAKRYSMALRQHAPLDPRCAAIGRIRPCLFPPQGTLYSLPHPCSTMTNQCLAIHQSVRYPPARVSETPPPQSIPGSDHAPWTWHRGRFASGRPTDSRCGARRKWHPHTGDLPPAGVPHQSGGCSRAPAIRAPVPSIRRRRGESLSSSGCLDVGHDSASLRVVCSC